MEKIDRNKVWVCDRDLAKWYTLLGVLMETNNLIQKNLALALNRTDLLLTKTHPKSKNTF